MCLDAPLRATHRHSRLRDVQPFEAAQHEGLLLAPRQGVQGFVQGLHRLLDLQSTTGRGLIARCLRDRVDLFLVILVSEGKPGQNSAAHRATALHVPDAILEDAVEKGLPLLRRPVRVRARQLQHGVLNRIQGVLFVAKRGLGDLEGLQLDARQKSVQRSRASLGGWGRQLRIVV